MAMSWPERDAAQAADRAACRAAIRNGSKSFFAASLLLPGRVRAPARALYAFCRLSDDLVDGPGARSDAVAALERRLERIYLGAPSAHPADRAFAEAAARFAIPRELPAALIEGLAWDAAGRRYRTLDELLAYATRVAGTVGAMMTLVMGVNARPALERATDLGIAMQLTNIARDVGEDARAGRIYLPFDWLEAAGLDPSALVPAPRFDPALGGLVARLLDIAESYYARAATGIVCLPLDCRPAIHAARLIYADIGRSIRTNSCDSVSRRAVIGTPRKLALLGRALAASAAPVACDPAPAAAPARYLVDFAASAALPAAAGTGLDGRIGRVIELIERLERRDHAARGGGLALARQPGD